MALLRIYQAAIFLSASLLFLVQPMFAKMVLPLLGGTPAVWNTCMLFFQFVLLVGYAYAHASTRWLGAKRQAVVHLIILGAVLLLPTIAVPADWQPPVQDTPVFWLLAVLAVSVGGPFFAVAATSPLLQDWFAATEHDESADPYFLYAASNFGSFLALLAYPFFVERMWRLQEQAVYWRVGYAVLVALMAACAAFVWKAKKANVEAAAEPALPRRGTAILDEKVSTRRRLYWVVLAFVPSSWMLGVTSYLTTDLAPVPLLWIVPLALYLLTFVAAFAARPLAPPNFWERLFPVAVLLLVTSLIFQGTWHTLPLHVAAFFIGAMVCHGDLAKDRPHVSRLTEFYLWISVGGVLGGVFNALIAPLVFPLFLEYPLTIFAACCLRPSFFSGDEKFRDRRSNFVLLAVYVLLVAAIANNLPFQGTVALGASVALGVPVLLALFLLNRARWFAVGVGLLLLLDKYEPPFAGRTIYVGRSFFGLHRVVDVPQIHHHRLLHGVTIHGIQNLDPQHPERHCEPLAYYFRSGPLGQLFAALESKEIRTVGIVGLGAGATACYCQSGQQFTFFEIDPIVKEIAEDRRLFTYLQDCVRGDCSIKLGDGRRTLAESPDGHFDLLVFDAFSSDAIPLHLLTREAIALYLQKSADHSVLAFHISNTHLDLKPVLAALAADANLTAYWCLTVPEPEQELAGMAAATYVVAARRTDDLCGLDQQPNWHKLIADPDRQPWTDDFSNIVDVIKWWQ